MTEIIHDFGECLRFLLHKKGISSEELVKQINQTSVVKTNKPAISRIINGKREATVEEIRIIANILDSPLLLEAFHLYKGYHDSHDETLLLAFYEAKDRIHCIDENLKEERPQINYAVLYQFVKNLYKQCLSYDISSQLKDGFLLKLYHVSGFPVMIQQLRAMYLCFFHASNLSKSDRAWLAAALLYFINPIDLIPDFIVGGGYTDDVIVTGFIFLKLSKVIHSYINKSQEFTPIINEKIESSI
ncbi:MAG: DUF1232 domain-containing protein [Bacillota bacterium]|nr:DUF1232 domain-containing protein [Bacillota bacterium]